MNRINALAIAAATVLVAVAGQPRGVLGPATVLASESDLGSKIAFTTDRDGRDAPDEIYVMNADGTDERRLTVTESGNNLFPEWSPNGNMIAFQNNRAEIGGPEIFLIHADGTGLTRLTHMTELGPGAVNAAWSPDGKKIAFNSAINPDIYVINADGPDEPVLRLTFAPGADIAPDWSPNGKKITFGSNRDDGNREIYVMNADGTEQLRLTFDDRIDAFPSWSPDGQWIAFHRQVFVFEVPGLGPPNGSEIFVIRANGSQERQVTRRAPASFSAFGSWAQGHASKP